MDIVIFLIFAATFGYIFYKWATKNNDEFVKRGIPFEQPFLFLGSSGVFLNRNSSFHKWTLKIYNESKQHKMYGMFHMREPFFLVNDPYLVKTLGVTDFDNFINHYQFFNSDIEPITGNMLNMLKDQRWRDMRNALTPIFTAAKMRSMFGLMLQTFDDGMAYLASQPAAEFDMEMKDFFSRLSNDLIASTAFGEHVNSFVDRENAFYRARHDPAKMGPMELLKMFVGSNFPILYKLLGLSIFQKDKTEYFVRLILDAMKYREEHDIHRPDMINLLMEMRKDSTHNWSDNEIVAQCFIFFFAAFENNTLLLCTSCYEMALNPAVQQRLYEEVMQVNASLNGSPLTYDTLKEMKYMDMVVSEALRKWPILAMADRQCNKDYTVRDEAGNKVCELKAGDMVWFHILALHWDEQYFEEPAAFRPERFSDQNKHAIKPYTYMPFGIGPRNCIGNRYALMQAKAMLFYLLRDYEVLRSEKTVSSLMDDVRGMQLAPKSGYWMRLRKRREQQ